MIFLAACNSSQSTDEETAKEGSNNESAVEKNTQEEDISKESPAEQESEPKSNLEELNKNGPSKEFQQNDGQNDKQLEDKNFGGDGWSGRKVDPSKEESNDEPAIESGTSEVALEDALYQYLLIDTLIAYTLENEAILAYESVTGANYTDDPTTLKVLEEDVIPVYTQFVEELNKIEVNNADLKEVHETYIEGAEKQLEAFHIFAEGIETQNITLVNEGNIILAEGVELINEYVEQIQSMRAEFGL